MAEAIGYDGTIKQEARPASIGGTTTGGIGPEGVGRIAAAYPDWGQVAQDAVNAGRAYLGYKESVATTDHKNAQQVYQGYYSEGAKATLDELKARMEAEQWTDEQFNDKWDAAEKRLRADAAAKTNAALKGIFFNQDGVYTRDSSFRAADDRLWALRNASSEAEKHRYLLNYRQQQTAIARSMGLATVGNVAANVEGARMLATEQLSSDPTINELNKTSLTIGTMDNVYTRDNATYIEQLNSVTGEEFQAQVTDRLAVSDHAGVEKLASDATASIKSIGEEQKALVEYAAEQEIALAEEKAKSGAISQEQRDYFISNAGKKKEERLAAIDTNTRNRAIELGRVIRTAKIADTKATLEALNKAAKGEKVSKDEIDRVADFQVKLKDIKLETTDTQPDYVNSVFGSNKNKTPLEAIVLATRAKINALVDEDPDFVEKGLNYIKAAANALSGNDQTTLVERERALENLKGYLENAATHATSVYGDAAKDKLYAIEQGKGKLTMSQATSIAQKLLHQTIASRQGLKLNVDGTLNTNQMFAGKDPSFITEFDFFLQNYIPYIAESPTQKDLRGRLKEVADTWVNLSGNKTQLTDHNVMMAIGGSEAGQLLALEETARARTKSASTPADGQFKDGQSIKPLKETALSPDKVEARANIIAKEKRAKGETIYRMEDSLIKNFAEKQLFAETADGKFVAQIQRDPKLRKKYGRDWGLVLDAINNVKNNTPNNSVLSLMNERGITRVEAEIITVQKERAETLKYWTDLPIDIYKGVANVVSAQVDAADAQLFKAMTFVFSQFEESDLGKGD